MTQEKCKEIDYTDPKQVIFAFWEGNIKQDYSCVDLDEITDRLLEFATREQKSWETDFWDYHKIYHVTPEMFNEALDKGKGAVKELELEHSKQAREISKVVNELNKAKAGKRLDKVLAIDRALDYQHGTGSMISYKGTLLDYIKMDRLRQEFEELHK